MASVILQEIIQRSIELDADEKLELIVHLVNSVRIGEETPSSRSRWSDIEGAMAHPMVGEDAQQWVTRSRDESDDRLVLLERGE